VEQALSHRSGIANVTNSEEFWSSCYLDPTQSWKPLDILKMVRQRGEARFSPGEDYDYCNANYILLGKLIEFVSGLSCGESLQKNILERIGLENTFPIERTYGSFGGHGDGPRFAYPLDLFLTSRHIHVLDMARSGDKIKTYDRSGTHVATSGVERGVSPRLFVDDDRYVAVRSGPDVLNRPPRERLEILSRSGAAGAVLGTFPAEDKLILEAFVPMGRYILLENDINIFPRLIVHFDGAMLYLGRSDAYTIKRIDLNGGEDLAFSIAGRAREPLPRDYAVNLAGRKKVAGTKEMTGETKDQFIARFPERQVFYTKIATDERGLVYVFGPDVTDFGTQEIDIFSPEGEYLYRAVLELPGGQERISPLAFDGERVYALVGNEEGAASLVK
jgi:hypothetical protein